MSLLRIRCVLPAAIFAALLSSACGQTDIITTAASAQAAADTPTPLPNKAGSYKFAVLGDFGTGSKEQYQLAEQMVKVHAQFKFDDVILVGDNLYGSERPQDFKNKFEVPYKGLLDAGVKFYASLGNHDAREQRY